MYMWYGVLYVDRKRKNKESDNNKQIVVINKTILFVQIFN